MLRSPPEFGKSASFRDGRRHDQIVTTTKKRHSNCLVFEPFSVSSLRLKNYPELFIDAQKSSEALYGEAFALNNVLDFSKYISFFWNNAYEKFFLGFL
jgi:hypothetical protein